MVPIRSFGHNGRIRHNQFIYCHAQNSPDRPSPLPRLHAGRAVCLAAASGCLNGQPATVTWWLADTLRKRYPKIGWQSEQNSIFNQRNATASGVNGYLPIAQSLIERHVSAEIFRDLTKLMVLPRPAQSHDAFQAISLIEQIGRAHV